MPQIRPRDHDSSLSLALGITVCVELHLRDGRTDGRRDASLRPSALRPSVRPSVRSFVSLSVMSVRGVHPMGGTNRDVS